MAELELAENDGIAACETTNCQGYGLDCLNDEVCYDAAVCVKNCATDYECAGQCAVAAAGNPNLMNLVHCQAQCLFSFIDTEETFLF